MMAEFKRVLRPNGQIIISSPEKYEYSVAPNLTNSFHVKELYRHEFEKLLKAYFSHIVIFGQRVLYGSAIFCEDIEAEITTYDSQDRILHSTKGLKRPLYLIAIASDRVKKRTGPRIFRGNKPNHRLDPNSRGPQCS